MNVEAQGQNDKFNEKLDQIADEKSPIRSENDSKKSSIVIEEIGASSQSLLQVISTVYKEREIFDQKNEQAIYEPGSGAYIIQDGIKSDLIHQIDAIIEKRCLIRMP